jgi:hypothetical protein
MSAGREVAPTNMEPAPPNIAVSDTGHAPAVTATPTEAHAASVPVRCANCGASLAGRYCANCGQRVEHAVHSLSHFVREVAEDLTHADSRVWQTIRALLFKPGYLTREFLAGRRVKYLPPLRLYLVLSLFFFVIAAINNRHSTLRLVDAGGHEISFDADSNPTQSGEDRRKRAEQACAKIQYGGPWATALQSALRKSCQNAAEDNGRSLKEAYFHSLPRAIFLMVPILAAVMLPLYRRQRRYYVEHLLFLLHNHAFAFLWLGMFVLLTLVIPGDTLALMLALVFGLYILYYYYRSMRQVYGEDTARTLGKFAVLSLAYLITAGLVLVATGLYSVLVQ